MSARSVRLKRILEEAYRRPAAGSPDVVREVESWQLYSISISPEPVMSWSTRQLTGMHKSVLLAAHLQGLEGAVGFLDNIDESVLNAK